MQLYHLENIALEIYGGSHDEAIGVIAEGLPVGASFDLTALNAFLKRRAPGRNAFSTSRRESDLPEFTRGVSVNGEAGVLTEETFEAVICNSNTRSSDYSTVTRIPRPSHADYAAIQKYGGDVDLRGGGHFSGRLTAPLCVLGGICKQLLEQQGIFLGAHLYAVGDVYDTPLDPVDPRIPVYDEDAFPVLDPAAGDKMQQVILEAKARGDSVGSVIECAASGLPAGLGEHMFRSAESRIAQMIFAIPAVKGIEFGSGFACGNMYGSKCNDPFRTDGTRVFTETNHSGGVQGGMTNGMPLILRIAVKPTPSIAMEQKSVDLIEMKNTTLKIQGRHDPCIGTRAVAAAEAALAVALLDMTLDKRRDA